MWNIDSWDKQFLSLVVQPSFPQSHVSRFSTTWIYMTAPCPFRALPRSHDWWRDVWCSCSGEEKWYPKNVICSHVRKTRQLCIYCSHAVILGLFSGQSARSVWHQQLDIKSLKETETTWTTASGSKAHDSHFLVGTLSTLYLLALLHCALLCLSWYVYVFVCGWLGDHLLSNITCGFSK